MNLDAWLAALYKADIRNQRAIAMPDFKTAMESDAALKTAAQAKLIELNAMIDARGEGACAYSTKYRNYLREALA